MSQLRVGSGNNSDKVRKTSSSSKARVKEQTKKVSLGTDGFSSSGTSNSASRNLQSSTNNSPSYSGGYTFNTKGLSPGQVASAVGYGSRAKMAGYRNYMDRAKYEANEKLTAEVVANDAELMGIADAEGNQLTANLLNLMQTQGLSPEQFKVEAKKLINTTKNKIEAKTNRAKEDKVKSQRETVMNRNLQKMSRFTGKELTDEDRIQIEELTKEIIIED